MRPFVEMAMWLPKESLREVVNTKALAAGTCFRPINDTIRDTLEWVRTERGDARMRAGASAERERELLAKWRARRSDK